MEQVKFRPIIAITMGDPAGIGPEIILKSLKNPRIYEVSRPIVIGNESILHDCAQSIGIDIEIHPIKSIAQSQFCIDCIDLINVGDITTADIKIGCVDPVAGKASIAYIEESVRLALSHQIDGIVTAPITKESLALGGSQLLEHTELLAHLTNSKDVTTIFLVDNVKIFFVTRHLSLKDAVNALNKDVILKTIIKADISMCELGYDSYKMAVAALNPHAGEGGLFGDEEIHHIIPAIIEAQNMGINVKGPIGADSVFHQAIEGKYDCVISLYHDQGHIAAKTRDFYGTITATLGLPVLRTSVDHGTGLDIARKGIANHRSMEKAILACAEMVKKKRCE